MSRVFVFAILAFAAGCDFSAEPKYFEGTVALRIEIESMHERLPTNLLYTWYGRAEHRTYKDGNFRIDYDDGEIVSSWYTRAENREYSLRTCDGFIVYDDVGTSQANITAVERPAITREIAGYSANAIELHDTDDDGEVTIWRYWYAQELPVNPEWFSEYRVGAANLLYEHIDSLVIGYESESPYASIRKFATEVRHRPVSDDELALPDIEQRHMTFEESASLPPCAGN